MGVHYGSLMATHIGMNGKAIALKDVDKDILDAMANGRQIRTVAEKYELSRTAVNNTMFRLKKRVGAKTAFQLAYWWGMNPRIRKENAQAR